MKLLGLLSLLAAFSLTNAQADTQTRNYLMRQLQTRGPSPVKLQAVDSLRAHLGHSQVRRSLENLVANPNGDRATRVEAVKVLSLVVNTNSTTSRVLKNAHNRSTDVEFRAAVIRALYRRAMNDRDVYVTLTRNLQGSADLRIKLASAFGLKDAAGRNDVARGLSNVLNNPTADLSLRIAVLKALYSARNDNRLQENIRYIASNPSEPAALRTAALRFTKSFGVSSRHKRFVLQLANQAMDAEVKAAAMDALKFSLSENDVRWLELSVDPRNGQVRDPLDFETLTFTRPRLPHGDAGYNF